MKKILSAKLVLAISLFSFSAGYAQTVDDLILMTETVWTLNEVYDYYAFHKETPDSLVRNFQNALDDIKKKPEDRGKSEYEKILDKYLK